MIKYYSRIIIVLSFTNCLYSQTVYFQDPSYTGDTYPIVIQSILINDSLLAIGDEIAVFDIDENGLGINSAIIFDGSYPVLMFSKLQTIVPSGDTIQGALIGNQISFRLWDASENYEYMGAAVFSSGGSFGDGFATNVDLIEANELTAIINSNLKPLSLILNQNYPNPFNPSTIIGFSIKHSSQIKLIIYDALGNKIKEVVNKSLPVGFYEYIFEPKSLSSGVYYYSLSNGNKLITKKMIFIK